VYRRPDGRRGALNGKRIVRFSAEKGMGIIKQGRGFSYRREYYQRLGEWNLLVIGCCISY
jgi:hypothetical protein